MSSESQPFVDRILVLTSTTPASADDVFKERDAEKAVEHLIARLQAAEAEIARLKKDSAPAIQETEPGSRQAGGLQEQIQDVARVVKAISKGDFSQTMTTLATDSTIAEINADLDKSTELFKSLTSRIKENAALYEHGELGGQAVVLGTEGAWRETCVGLNAMWSRRTDCNRMVAEAALSAAHGDFRWDTLEEHGPEYEGEARQLKDAVQTLRRIVHWGRLATPSSCDCI